MKSLIASIAIVGLVGLAIGTGAGAAEVTATVTPQNIAVSLSASTVSYGVLDLSTSDGDRVTAFSGTFTATNDSNVLANFTIKGTDTNNGWTLNFSPADVGTVAADQFVHRFDANTVFGDGTAKALSTSVQTLGSAIPVNGTQDFVLQMNMPTASANAAAEQSSTVTVVASAP